jgi:hypothetical protein
MKTWRLRSVIGNGDGNIDCAPRSRTGRGDHVYAPFIGLKSAPERLPPAAFAPYGAARFGMTIP